MSTSCVFVLAIPDEEIQRPALVLLYYFLQSGSIDVRRRLERVALEANDKVKEGFY